MPPLRLSDATLSFVDQGQGPAVLLLHAFPLSSEAFRPQLDALSGRFRLIAPDHRGFGQSTGPDGQTPTTMQRLAQDALAILDHLGLSTAVVVGVSMGSYAALALLKEDPSRLRALVLVNARPVGDDAAGKVQREARAQTVLRDGMQTLVDSMLPQFLTPTSPKGLKEELTRLILANPPAGAAAALRGMALRPDSKEILSRFAGPTLVMAGEKDPITPFSHAQQIAELISGSSLLRLEGAGHLPNQDSPDAFNQALGSFLESL